MSTTAPEPAMRASDAERDDVAELLREQAAAGRLTLAELEERIAAAYGARTRTELRELTVDLPAHDTHHESPPPPTDIWLLCVLLCLCPPAGLVYLLARSRRGGVQERPGGSEHPPPDGLAPPMAERPPARSDLATARRVDDERH